MRCLVLNKGLDCSSFTVMWCIEADGNNWVWIKWIISSYVGSVWNCASCCQLHRLLQISVNTEACTCMNEQKQLKLTKLPSAGLVAELVEIPAPHIWREKTSGMPVCFTSESKKGSTDGSG